MKGGTCDPVMGCVELDFGADGQADYVLAHGNLTVMMSKMAESSN